VVTDVGDSGYVVGDTGRVIPPKNVKALAGAIEELLGMAEEERRALGRKARERVREHFEIGKVVRQLEALYVDLGRRRRRCAG